MVYKCTNENFYTRLLTLEKKNIYGVNFLDVFYRVE